MLCFWLWVKNMSIQEKVSVKDTIFESFNKQKRIHSFRYDNTFQTNEICFSCLMPVESIEGIPLHAGSSVGRCNIGYLKDKYPIVGWWYFFNKNHSIFRHFTIDVPNTRDEFNKWLFSKNNKRNMYNYLIITAMLFNFFYLH